jgi:hypothetical protein
MPTEVLSLYTNPWALIAPRRFVPVVTAAAPGGDPESSLVGGKLVGSGLLQRRLVA